MQSNTPEIKNIIGKEKYFVHKGTWKNDYEWRIQKVKITGVHIDKNRELFVEFGFDCVGYEYPLCYLKGTMDEAKEFAIQQIRAEKKRQIASIKEINK